MLRVKNSLALMAMVAALTLALSFGAAASSITLGYVEWDCAIANTHIVAAIMEEHFDMDVELVSVEAGIMWTGLAQGDLDVILTAWLPVTHGFYLDEYGDDVVDLGVNFEGAAIGLVVPTYVDIDSIEDMVDHAAEFNNMIYGIDPGAGIMAATDEALDVYGLPMTVLDSSDAAMTIQLGQAYADEEWIVVTGWVPHWKFDVYDLKFLDDPENIYGGAENIHTFSRTGFDEDFDADVLSFFDNYFLTQEQLHEMMNIVREGDDTELELARQWIADNDDAVQQWLQ